MAKSDFKPLSDALAKLNANRKTVAKKEPARPPPQMSLELWPDSVRGVPNAVLRGAVFSVSQIRTSSKKRELIASVEGQEIRFLGVRFNQTDLDVWEMLLHLGRQQPLGNRVEFSAHSLLKALGRGTSGKHHEELKEEIARLTSGLIEITWTADKRTYGGSLVTDFFRDEATQRYVVIFNQKMLGLYEGGYSHIDWEQRQALGKNSLAKWLHGFYATHAVPHPYRVETIRNLCGSTAALPQFRQKLKLALAQLEKIGAITAWEIGDDDLVRVSKIPTLSQKKHLGRLRR
ncbi:plasmid replication initiator TrfA [Janthinobacterium sp. CG3]|uniref:plasmid replication initiator TrfA n=1 Tax=Janthinobacterium sp. CG3 TaxID=1075768 RepID=UPI0009DB1DBC|nr:plasmid replication initiator TrfA [Janthinobacterium sp. CG3]